MVINLNFFQMLIHNLQVKISYKIQKVRILTRYNHHSPKSTIKDNVLFKLHIVPSF